MPILPGPVDRAVRATGIPDMRRKRLQASNQRRHYRQFLHRGELCFDVGANIGERTAMFKSLGARVIAVEPQKACIVALQHRFIGSRTVSIVPVALGPEPGTAEIAICDTAPTISTMALHWRTEGRFSREYRWERTEQVPVTTLDDLIGRYGRPAFCKIDVEGFEEHVLQGLTQPIAYLSFEFTREFLDHTERCVKHLSSIGRADFSYSRGENLRLEMPWAPTSALFDRLRRAVETDLWGDIYVRFRDITAAS